MAKGLDQGTSFIVSSQKVGDKIKIEKRRNAFLDLPSTKDTKKILDQLKVSYIVRGNKVLVFGEQALSLANSFGREARRPMNKGVISAKDELSLDVLPDLISDVLGEPNHKNEICCYTVPAKALGDEDFDVEYHRDTIGGILKNLGYTPFWVPEALCVAYDQLTDKNLTGLVVDLGAGMTNVCLAQLGIATKSFSLLRGGDWIDKSLASRKEGMTASRATKIKESPRNPIDIVKDYGSKDIMRDAVAKYYQILIEWVVKNIEEAFSNITLDDPIPVVVAGGTSLISGFIPVFETFLRKASFRFEIDQVIHAEDPLYSVAHGALIRALMEEDDAN